MFTQLTSLPYLRNWSTRTVHFCLLPLIDLALLLLIAGQYQPHLNAAVAVSSIGLSGFSLAMSAFASLMVTDIDLKIDRVLVVNRPFSWHYWGTKVLVAGGSGLIMIIINLLFLAGIGLAPGLLWKVVWLSPLLCLSGIIVGFVCVVLAWTMANPYFVLNWVMALVPVLSGATAVLQRYPSWLRSLSDFLPLAHTLGVLHGSTTSWYTDCGVDVVWLGIGLLAFRWQYRSLSRHPQRSW